jgi:DNA polymerase elongation subunit (family B)
LINLEGDPNRGGYLIVDEFNENPGLSKDDRFYIKNWKVGYSNSQGLGNLSFDFEVQVMSLQKTLFRHEELLTEIFVESPNREEIKKLVDALRERNPDVIKSLTNN